MWDIMLIPYPKFQNKKIKIAVVVNWFTKMIRLKVTTIAISLEKIAKIYRDNI